MIQEERVILTLADIAEEFDVVENEEIVFAEELEHIGAKNASEVFFIGIMEDDINEGEFISETETETIKGSDIYGLIGLNDCFVTKGKIKGYPAFKVYDGISEFVFAGPDFKLNLL
jgi:hypothetical protein